MTKTAGFLVVGIVVASSIPRAHGDSGSMPATVCVRGVRKWPCPNGTMIDVCDAPQACPKGGSAASPGAAGDWRAQAAAAGGQALGAALGRLLFGPSDAADGESNAREQAQREAVMRELERQRAEAQRKRQDAEAKRLHAICDRLLTTMKGVDGRPALQPALQLKVGGHGEGSGYGIPGLPGIYTNGPREQATAPGAPPQVLGGLALKGGPGAAVDPAPATPESPREPPPDISKMSPAQITDAVRTLPPDGQAALVAAAEGRGAAAPVNSTSGAGTPGQPEGPAQVGSPASADASHGSSQALGQLAEMERPSSPTSFGEAASMDARKGFDTPVAGTTRAGPGADQPHAPGPPPRGGASRASTSTPAAVPPATVAASSVPALPLQPGPGENKPAEPPCVAVEAQLARDEGALRRQREANQAGLRELGEWEKENEDAQRAALKVATDALAHAIVDRFVEILGERIDEIKKGLDGKVIRQKDRWFMEELARKSTELEQLQAVRDGLKLARIRKDTIELWNQLHELHDKARLTAIDIGDFARKLAGNGVVTAVAERALLAAANDFEKRLLKAGFPLVEDSIKLGNLLVDYTYEAWRWTASRNRILQQNNLTEDELKAVAALGCQIERSVIRLHECRGTSKPPPSGRCVRSTQEAMSP